MKELKHIVITGGGAGIGRAVARRFLAEGWKVAVLGRNAAPLEETVAGHAALVLPCDVGIPDEVDRAFEAVRSTWGRIDVLFNNAGIMLPGKPIDEIAVSDWQALMAVNISGMFLCARAAFGLMRAQNPQGGRIINNGSVSAHAPRPGSAPYTMAKHAVTGLTKSLALDGRAFQIACGQIDIGNARTALAEGIARGIRQADGSLRAEPMMELDHVSDAVLHMADLPLSVNIPFMTVMARDMPLYGRG